MKLLFNVFLFLIDAYVDAASINNVDSKNIINFSWPNFGAHPLEACFMAKVCGSYNFKISGNK